MKKIPVIGLQFLLLSCVVFSQITGGALDPTFGSGGKVTTDFNNLFDLIIDMALFPDGKIIAVGRNGTDWALAKYNADGSLDTSFDTDGKITVSLSTANDEARGVAVQPDGKIVVGGFAGTRAERIVARYNANGSLDNSFGTNGLFRTSLAAGSPATSPTTDDGEIVIQPDGKIIVVGTTRVAVASTTTNAFSLMRLNTDGTLDTTFDGDGKVTTTFVAGDAAWDARLLPDGKIIVVGSANNSGLIALARYNSDGSLDTTFDGDGKLTTGFPSGAAAAFSLDVQPDGKYIVAGTNGGNFAVARYNSNGSLDTSFDTDGRATINFGGTEQATTVLFRNGKIYVSGSSGISTGSFFTTTFSFALGVLNSDGSLDTSFGGGGKLLTKFGFYTDSSASALLQPDGKLLLGGFLSNIVSETSSGRLFALARYNLTDRPKAKQFDFDGDSFADPGVYRGGEWFFLTSGYDFRAATFGGSLNKIAPADYDGDLRTDYAVFYENPSDPGRAEFYIYNSMSDTVRVEQFGATGDKPAGSDWDGDGFADLAVFRSGQNAGAQSNFYFRPSGTSGINFTTVPWGISGDKPVAADYDGDGRTDAAVFRPSDQNWYIRRSSDNQIRVVKFGLGSDRLVPADYDGDGRADIAVYRDGFWYIQQSTDGFRAVQFGLPTDRLVPADYDGDGRTDLAVYRDGEWYVLFSSNNTLYIENFGLGSDTPIQAAAL